MSENTNIVILSAILVILLVAIGWIGSYQNSFAQDAVIDNKPSGQIKNLIVTTGLNQEQSTKKVIVHERFVGEVDEDGVIVAMNNGQASNVRNGVVLIDGMLITANEEGYSVLRVNDYEKSVSSN